MQLALTIAGKQYFAVNRNHGDNGAWGEAVSDDKYSSDEVD